MNKDRVTYIILGVISVGIIFILYSFYSAFPNRVDTTDSWLNTATIINGLITPLLTSLSIVLIWMTWRVSKKELNSTRELLETQVRSQKVKDELEVFSRRATVLRSKFYDTKMTLDSLNKNTTVVLLLTQIIKYNEEVSTNRAYEGLSQDQIAKIVVDNGGIMYGDTKFDILMFYFLKYQFSLSETFQEYKYTTLYSESQFIEHAKRLVPYPDKLLKATICFSLCTSDSPIPELSMFRFLINKVLQQTDLDRKMFIEEFNYVFDYELAEKIIMLTEHNADTILKEFDIKNM